MPRVELRVVGLNQHPMVGLAGQLHESMHPRSYVSCVLRIGPRKLFLRVENRANDSRQA